MSECSALLYEFKTGMEKIMSLSERHQKILELLKVNGIVSVNSLSRQLNVSSVTIRKDLGLLEEKKLLYRSHGGAIQIDPYIANRHVQEKEKQFPEEKEKDWYEGCRNADSQ